MGVEKKVKAVEIVEKKEVQKVETTPAMVLDFAIEKGASLEQIEKFMDLKEKWEQREAKKAYVRDMAAFKANPPEILKTAKLEYVRKDGRITKYNHAVLDEIAAAINIGLSGHGFYARWDMKQPDIKTVEVTCILTHELGHSESFVIKAPADESDGKNPIQAISSTNTYLERISLLGITGLAAKGMDNDGNGNISVEYITDKQLKIITDIVDNLKNAEKRKPKMLEVFKVENLAMIQTKDFNKVMTALKAAQDADKKVKA